MNSNAKQTLQMLFIVKMFFNSFYKRSAWFEKKTKQIITGVLYKVSTCLCSCCAFSRNWKILDALLTFTAFAFCMYGFNNLADHPK